ncbi:hypothetical protein Hs30E_12860 [Lactococcus hodotermopsidis]|uniref:Uncharacterized protein n=1 Tax=Pseudolactococcus hodotermopsidis TaxID=2709157 RepID=A0A6A0BDI7_9LACT|nr:hypothetical protein [Lactococcus hodotermopsidis]GFH42735.1 hypothetical protein Hs30E_12860 [Lactococcus hodotermopsidis]
MALEGIEKWRIEKWALENLENFKDRMRISTTAEDENLKQMLLSSANALIRLTGARDFNDPTLVSLIFDRARYEYNDALDEFAENYREEVNLLYIQHGLEDEDDFKSETTQK